MIQEDSEWDRVLNKDYEESEGEELVNEEFETYYNNAFKESGARLWRRKDVNELNRKELSSIDIMRYMEDEQ